MAYDLSVIANTGIATQLCGDAHVRNLGAFAGPDGRLVFDINDFDETVVGPFEWDVKRLATSLILAGREASVGGQHCRRGRYCLRRSLPSHDEPLSRLCLCSMWRVTRCIVLGECGPVSAILLAAKRSTPALNLRALTEPDPKNKSERIFRTEPPALERLTGSIVANVIASLVPYEESLLPGAPPLFWRSTG